MTTMVNVLNREEDSGFSAECATTGIEVGARVVMLFVGVLPAANVGREANKDTQVCFEHHQGHLGLELSVIALAPLLLNWDCADEGLLIARCI